MEKGLEGGKKGAQMKGEEICAVREVGVDVEGGGRVGG